MSVSNGQNANETTFNGAFMSRTADTSTTGVVNLNNTTDGDSGDEIANAQQFINEIADSDGTAGQDDADRKNYANNNYIVDGDSRKTAIERLDAALAIISAANFSTWVEHAVTDGQSAGDLGGETIDSDEYSSGILEYEVIRGTTVIANGRLSMQCLNGTWRVETGSYEGDLHGVTFSVTQATTVAQLQAALDVGAGNGTIKISRRLVPV